MQKLFLSGKSEFTVKAVGDLKFNPPGTSGNTARKRCSYPCIEKMLAGFADQYPRLAVYDSEVSTLALRALPVDETTQDRVHNDCMLAVKFGLRAVSEARVRWISSAASSLKRGQEAAVPGVSAAPANVPQRARRSGPRQRGPG